MKLVECSLTVVQLQNHDLPESHLTVYETRSPDTIYRNYNQNHIVSAGARSARRMPHSFPSVAMDTSHKQHNGDIFEWVFLPVSPVVSLSRTEEESPVRCLCGSNYKSTLQKL